MIIKEKNMVIKAIESPLVDFNKISRKDGPYTMEDLCKSKCISNKYLFILVCKIYEGRPYPLMVPDRFKSKLTSADMHKL